MPNHKKNKVSPQIRPATPDDAGAICQMIKDLAEYEKLSHQVKTTPESVREQLFTEGAVAQAVVVEVDDADDAQNPKAKKTVAFALYFCNFSTFECKPGLYLEDLYVMPEWRGHGIGKNLLRHLAHIAVEKGYARFEWSVLDWNQPAIDVYHAVGAQILDEWRICRMTGDALINLAAQSPLHKHKV